MTRRTVGLALALLVLSALGGLLWPYVTYRSFSETEHSHEFSCRVVNIGFLRRSLREAESGVLHGPFRIYRESDGELLVEGAYVDGRRVGAWIDYFPSDDLGGGVRARVAVMDDSGGFRLVMVWRSGNPTEVWRPSTGWANYEEAEYSDVARRLSQIEPVRFWWERLPGFSGHLVH